MSSSPEQNRFAPPAARVDDVATGTFELGGRGQRFVAAFADGLILGAIYYALAFTVLSSVLPDPRTGANATIGGTILSILVYVVLFALVQGWFLVKQGQTIGKKLLGLRIVRPDGQIPDAMRVIGLRYLLFWVVLLIPFIGALVVLLDVLLIFRDSRKCLHDNVADTIVIKA